MTSASRLARFASRRSPVSLLTLAVLALFAVAAAGCGDDGDKGTSKKQAASNANSLVIYSGREQKLAKPLFKRFEIDTGIDLEVRYAESPELAATLAEEGDNSPADVFYAQDSGSIGSIEGMLAPLPAATLALVEPRFRDEQGRWTGVTGRVRVLIYNTEEVKAADLPNSVLDVIDKRFRGKLGIAPTNSSFVAFVSGMRQTIGDKRTLAWLEAVKANEPRIYEKNSQIAEAVGEGEVQYGLVNHYYLYERLEKNPDLPIANHLFAPGDPGRLVNVSAAGILTTAKRPKLAQQFIEYLLEEGQAYIANDAPEREYPLVMGAANIERAKELPPLDQIKGPDVDLGSLGSELRSTVELIEKSGLGS